LKPKISCVIIVLLLAFGTMSLVSQALATNTLAPAQAQPSPVQATKVVSATGNGWFMREGKKDEFNFYVNRGTLKANDWRYNPNGQASYTGRDFKTAPEVIQAWSTKVWRYKIEKIDDGYRVIIAGIATVKIGDTWRSNWWFRITAKDATAGKDAFMLQLWRPIGADKAGGWSPKDFDATKPGSIHLNNAPAYQSQATLGGGNVKITP